MLETYSMNVRLISGRYGGRTIKSPNSDLTHPMSERLRGSMFNIIADEVSNATVLDAFAGTGSIGLEALSRGAKDATFIERDRLAADILTENINTLNADKQATIFRMGLDAWINKSQGNFYDIIFADPPYKNTQLSTVVKLLGMLKPKGLMVVSYPGSGEVPTVKGFVVVDNRIYGNAALAFYRRKDS